MGLFGWLLGDTRDCAGGNYTGDRVPRTRCGTLVQPEAGLPEGYEPPSAALAPPGSMKARIWKDRDTGRWCYVVSGPAPGGGQAASWPAALTAALSDLRRIESRARQPLPICPPVRRPSGRW